MLTFDTELNQWAGTHIIFRSVELPAGSKRKTAMWGVFNKYEARPENMSGFLGRVSWFARWRKYSFFPQEGCVFEEKCLREVAEFMEARTKEHKQQAKAA